MLAVKSIASHESQPGPAIVERKGNSIAGDHTSLASREVVTGLSLIAQIAAIVFWARWANSQHLVSRHGISWIILVLIASIAATFCHEIGHAVLAWCFQMRLLSFKVGPFHWVNCGKRWSFSFHPAGLYTPGGSVGAIPTHPDQPRWEELVMLAAGPAANLLFGSAALWAILHDRWASYQSNWELIAYIGAFCLLAAVLNLIPFRSEDGGYSDGARILQIITRSPLDDFHRTLTSIASTSITPRRYRDLDITAIERTASLFPNEFRGLHLRLCACHFYEDSGLLTQASAALASAEAIYNNNSIDLPGPLHTIFVIGHAYLNRDAAAARLWWDRMQAKKYAHADVDYLLAGAALCWIEGRQQEAEAAWQKADLEAAGLPECGAFEFDRLLCTLLREAFDRTPRTAAPAPPPIEIAVPAPEPVPVSAPSPVIAIAPVSALLVEEHPGFARFARFTPAPDEVVSTPPSIPATPLAIAEHTPEWLLPATPLSSPSVAAEPEAVPEVIEPAEVKLIDAPASSIPLDETLPPPAPTPAEPVAADPFDRILAPSPGQPSSESAAARPASSTTRIPIAALKTVPARITLTTAPPPSDAPAPSPEPKAPAVPAAFARRARPAPLPASETLPYSALDTPASENQAISETPAAEASIKSPLEDPPQVVQATPAVEASVTLPPDVPPSPPPAVAPLAGTTNRFRIPEVTPPPPQPKEPRQDALDFIRAAMIETLNANAR